MEDRFFVTLLLPVLTSCVGEVQETRAFDTRSKPTPHYQKEEARPTPLAGKLLSYLLADPSVAIAKLKAFAEVSDLARSLENGPVPRLPGTIRRKPLRRTGNYYRLFHRASHGVDVYSARQRVLGASFWFRWENVRPCDLLEALAPIAFNYKSLEANSKFDPSTWLVVSCELAVSRAGVTISLDTRAGPLLNPGTAFRFYSSHRHRDGTFLPFVEGNMEYVEEEGAGVGYRGVPDRWIPVPDNTKRHR